MEDLLKVSNELDHDILSFLCKRYETNRFRIRSLVKKYRKGVIFHEEEAWDVTKKILENEDIASVINSGISSLHKSYVENHPDYTEEPLNFSWKDLQKRGFLEDEDHIDKKKLDSYIAKIADIQDVKANA